MRSNVGGCGGVSCALIGLSGRGVGGECGGTRLAHRDLATHPGTSCFDGMAGSVVFRVVLLEVRKYVLGALGGPEHQ
jgi:hypothetical protein